MSAGPDSGPAAAVTYYLLLRIASSGEMCWLACVLSPKHLASTPVGRANSKRPEICAIVAVSEKQVPYDAAQEPKAHIAA